MSAAQSAPEAPKEKKKGRWKVWTGVGLFLLVAIGLGAVLGSAGKNDEFKPQNEFKLDPWISLNLGPFDLSINKAVLYLFLASALTVITMVWIARRMTERPNRTQTAIELLYGLMRDNISGPQNLETKMALKWFPFIGGLFLFIWFSNLIGYIPLPTNTGETIDIFGFAVPAFSLYAATANISVTLMLTLMVWFSYNMEGVRAKGFIGYLRSWIPAGTPGWMKPAMFVIEAISHFVRIISLSVRLFANILAGHLLILFMAGGLAVILGLAAIGVFTLPAAIAFYIFEVGLVATLQAFIFATLTAIYLGGATAEGH